MRLKLGIANEEPQDERLIADLLGLMKAYQADYTNTFVDLTLEKNSVVGLIWKVVPLKSG